MVKFHKKYSKAYYKGYWYNFWDTYDTKYASRNRRMQWYLKNMIHPINEN